jgi:hypothetical protein
MTTRRIAAACLALVAIRAGAILHAQADQVAAAKQSLQQGLAKARQYEWIETTVISLKGEEKARTQKRCYYGAAGKVEKVSLDQPAKAAGPSKAGGRGGRVKEHVVEKKKDEMQDYMERAAALMQQYVPPSPERIQAAKDAGHITVTPQPGGPVHLLVAQYLQPGDSLSIDLDTAANRLLTLAVNTWLDKPEETVTLAVQMNVLPDGALYAAQTTLDAKAKNITVVIQNSGHRPVAKQSGDHD